MGKYETWVKRDNGSVSNCLLPLKHRNAVLVQYNFVFLFLFLFFSCFCGNKKAVQQGCYCSLFKLSQYRKRAFPQKTGVFNKTDSKQQKNADLMKKADMSLKKYSDGRLRS